MRILAFHFISTVILSTTIGWSQAPDSPEQTSDQRMSFMQQQAAAFRGTVGTNDKIQALDKPLLRWSNPHTNILDGVLVCWVDEAGVPAAAAQICLTPNSSDEWAIELQSLSQKPLTLTNGIIEDWRPIAAGLQWHSHDAVSKTSQTEKQRLVQMRALARRFRGDDDFENEESVLRLLTNPLLRYSNPKKGITDGAMFALVQGTDPEMLILIELRQDQNGNAGYYWALAPMTSFELTGYLDREEVWQKPQMTSNQPTDIFYQRLLIAGQSQDQPLGDRLRSLFGF